MEEDSEGFYRTLCSSETLRSGSKGFFRDFSESVINGAGEAWIEKIFGRLNSDVERVRTVLTDPRVKDIVSETLGRVKHLYRDKDAAISRNKRLEGLENAAAGNHEKALLLFSQAVLRAPATGKFPPVDQGFSLPLGLLARADTLMARGDYDFALEDLTLASEEDLPQTARAQLIGKIEECNRLLEESNKSLIAYGVSSTMANQSKRQYKIPNSPSLADGPSSRPEISGASKLVDIRETTYAGKHAVAAGAIVPGDVLASEAPLASCLIPEFYGTHCQHCLTRLRAPVGCPVCSSVAFCGRRCRDQALGTYHKYECKILALLVGSGMSVLSTLALRMVTQEGHEKCRRICEKLKQEKRQCTEKNSRVNERQVSGNEERVKKKEKEKNEDEEEEEEVGNLSKSAKRRLRKKKLKESSLIRDERNENTNGKVNEMKVDLRAYDLVRLEGRRSAKDFLERTLMALFLLKGLQKVRFFNKSSKSEESTTDEEIEIGALLLRNLQLLQFNAHEIYETRLASNHRYRGNKTVYVGVAIYPSVARFNHDCYPAVTRCTCLACVEDWPGFDKLTNYSARLRCTTDGCKGLLSQPRKPERPMKCSSCQKMKNLEGIMRNLADCEAEYTRGLACMEDENTEEAIMIFARALEKFHRIAVPPHRETHLAEIAFAACMADSGNTWRPVQ